MTNRSDEDDQLLNQLQQLPREISPPTRVGVDLARAVSRRAPLSRRGLGNNLRTAVAVVLVVAAFVGGRLTAPPAPQSGTTAQTFAFLLYGVSDGGSDAVVEYRAWASNQRREGRAVTGERLGQDAWVAGGTPLVDPLPLRGFFIVQAKDSVEAIEVARHHPHASSGTIVVRPVTTR